MNSFFDLMWADEAPDDHAAFLASLSESELAALHAEATPLMQALFSALHTHTEAHPTSMGACIHAAHCMAYSLERQLDEECADA